MSAWQWVVAALACGAGASVRYVISTLDRTGRFPWPTMTSNALGSALLGVIAAGVAHGGLDPAWLVVLGGGFAGGLTTFSTLAVDAVLLMHEGRRRALWAYLGGTFVIGLTAGVLGWAAWHAIAT